MRHFEGPLFRSLKCCPPAKHAKLGVKPRKFVRRCRRIGSDRAVAPKWRAEPIECRPVALILQTQGRRRKCSRREAVKTRVRLATPAVRTENRNEGYHSRRKVFRLAYPNQSSEPATIDTR